MVGTAVVVGDKLSDNDGWGVKEGLAEITVGGNELDEGEIEGEADGATDGNEVDGYELGCTEGGAETLGAMLGWLEIVGESVTSYSPGQSAWR
mmetsp:Transcript_25162/g.38740  ORF Transcript_25162/g.38740 Transcript_25162/m.38740 type:complete len:93 (-) Transcript_25162:566-844(-)